MPEHLLRTIHTRSLGLALLAGALAGANGCQSTSSTSLASAPAPATAAAEPSSAPADAAPTPAPTAEPAPTASLPIDPISREPVAGEGFVGYYGMWKVHFESAENAAQFASLAPAKRAKLAAPQVLKAKGIPNETCPLTGEPLTAAAAPVRYEGQVIGFASVADANQFNALTKKKQAQIIGKWQGS